MSLLETLIDEYPTPEARLLDAEKQAGLLMLLQNLPLRFRAPLILRDVEGLSYEEVAAVLGCSVGTVSSRLNRGRKMLARKLWGGFP
jgi:RNA polymerase sigma-70 factor (ECF subfamily)